MAMLTTSNLMREAMADNGISWDELAETARTMAREETDMAIGRFRNGGVVSINVAAAIIAIIVRRKTDG